MPVKNAPASTSRKSPRPDVDAEVAKALEWLQARSTARDRANLVRFGINARNAFGVSMANIQVLAKKLGRSHDLAAALWQTGRYEARMLAAFVDEPSLVTVVQMDRWCRDFDNWGICDTVCFKLFDRVPHAWKKVEPWSKHRDEFVKRAGFALIASLALHDKAATDAQFVKTLALIERGASDDRNFVKKGVSWAIRSVGRRSKALHAASLEVAERLIESDAPAAKWVGRDALRDLSKVKIKKS